MPSWVMSTEPPQCSGLKYLYRNYESTTETKHSTNWPLSQGNFPSHPLSTPESSEGVGISTELIRESWVLIIHSSPAYGGSVQMSSPLKNTRFPQISVPPLYLCLHLLCPSFHYSPFHPTISGSYDCALHTTRKSSLSLYHQHLVLPGTQGYLMSIC